MAAAGFTDMSFEGTAFCEMPLYPPPGLAPAPILDAAAVPLADTSEQELLLAYQEFVIARQECQKMEQRGAQVWEPSDHSIFCPVSSMPLQPLYTRGDVDGNVVLSSRCFAAPLKPPGVFMKSSSTHSLASTAASVTKELQESSSPAGAVEATWSLAEDVQKVENDCPKEVNRELQVEHTASGHLRISWPVDAKKLASKDQQIVSPIFEILAGCTFRLMLKPTQVGAKKGQASFKKAKGWGSADLKLVGCDGVAPTLRFGISVGSDYRGHLQHDFEDNAVNSNPKFDFTSAVDGSTFLVTLDVASNEEEQASSS